MSSAQRQKVLLVGATGETGRLILKGLLEAETPFEVVALIRPASKDKEEVLALKDKGVAEVRIGDAGDEVHELVKKLSDIDIVISTVDAGSQLDQFNLIDAIAQSGVKRFLPCAFTIVVPPGGIMKIRDDKEEVYKHIRKLYVPFTVVDCGFWHNISFPSLASGRVDYAVRQGRNTIWGDADKKTIVTDGNDIGKLVAKIIVDERTLNKFVVACGDVVSQNEIFDIMEKASGEKIDRNYVSEKDLADMLTKFKEEYDAEPESIGNMVNLFMHQYHWAKFVRGDNTPEHAAYLGYLNTRDLYPDFKHVSFESFVKNELLQGKVHLPYAKGISFGRKKIAMKVGE